MPNSLKSKLSKLRYKGCITNEEYKELIDKLVGHDAEIIAETIDEVIALARAEIDFESQAEQKRFADFMNQLKEQKGDKNERISKI